MSFTNRPSKNYHWESAGRPTVLRCVVTVHHHQGPEKNHFHTPRHKTDVFLPSWYRYGSCKYRSIPLGNGYPDRAESTISCASSSIVTTSKIIDINSCKITRLDDELVLKSDTSNVRRHSDICLYNKNNRHTENCNLEPKKRHISADNSENSDTHTAKEVKEFLVKNLFPKQNISLEGYDSLYDRLTNLPNLKKTSDITNRFNKEVKIIKSKSNSKSSKMASKIENPSKLPKLDNSLSFNVETINMSNLSSNKDIKVSKDIKKTIPKPKFSESCESSKPSISLNKCRRESKSNEILSAVKPEIIPKLQVHIYIPLEERSPNSLIYSR